MRRLWPSPDEDLFIPKHVNSSIRVGAGGMTFGGSAIRADEATPAISGGMALSGTAPHDGRRYGIGGMALSGSALRADEATIPAPSGGMVFSGSIIGANEATIVPSGGMVLSGFVEVAYEWHYGFWPSYGWWPRKVGWWFEPNYTYRGVGQ